MKTRKVFKYGIPLGEGHFTILAPQITEVLSVGTDAQGRPAFWCLILEDDSTTKAGQERQYVFYHGFTGTVLPPSINTRKFIGTYSNPLTGIVGHLWFHETTVVVRERTE